MRVVILQLARFGDILQTLPTIAGLKKKHKNCHITLVTRKTFSDAAKLSPHIDQLIEFDSAQILGPFIKNQTQISKENSLSRLATWTENSFFKDKRYDLLLNLTFSVSSSYLAQIIPAIEKRGLQRSPDKTYYISDPWSRYFYAQVLQKNMNTLHINELFMRIADVENNPWPIEVQKFELDPSKAPIDSAHQRIGIQVTASDPEKTINTSAWSKICLSIYAKHPNSELVFFGSQADCPIIEKVLDKVKQTIQNPRYKILAGTLKFHENEPWIKACAAIVCPDTAMVHFASILQVKTICIHMSPMVRSEETGPYGVGHHVVYPAKSDETQLAEAIANIISQEKTSNKVAISQTNFKKCLFGQKRNELTPTNFDPEEVRNFFAQAYYLLFEFRINGKQEDIEIPKLGGKNQTGAIDRLLNTYDALCYVKKLADYGQHYCIQMLDAEKNQKKLNQLMSKLNETEELLMRLRDSIPEIRPLVDSCQVAKESIISNDLEEMLQLTEGTYRELSQNVDIIHDLLNTAVKKAQENLQLNKSFSERYNEKLKQNLKQKDDKEVSQ